MDFHKYSQRCVLDVLSEKFRPRINATRQNLIRIDLPSSFVFALDAIDGTGASRLMPWEVSEGV